MWEGEGGTDWRGNNRLSHAAPVASNEPFKKFQLLERRAEANGNNVERQCQGQLWRSQQVYPK